MEDTHVIIDDLSVKFPDLFPVTNPVVKRSIYAVYDGHGGRECAILAEKLLHKSVITDPKFKEEQYTEALRNGFYKADKQIEKLSQEQKWMNGSTVVVALIIDDTVYLANSGDSECVLAHKRDGKYEKIILSQIHRPNQPEEKKRITEAGATVKDGRINSFLAVSRGLGDFDLKRPLNNAEADFVSIEPYIMNYVIAPDDFLIIACDGLWEEIGHQEAIDIVTKAKKSNKAPSDAADMLVKEALDKGSLDNITVIVVYF